MLAQHLRHSIQHMAWADALTWRAVIELPRRPDALTRQRLYHIHAVQWAYLDIWRSEFTGIPDESRFSDLESIFTWGRQYHARVAAWAESLETEPLDRAIEVPWEEQLAAEYGEVRPATLAETVHQITAHSMHHRGQVIADLRGLGGEPPLADFVVWVWLGRPAAEWPDVVEA